VPCGQKAGCASRSDTAEGISVSGRIPSRAIARGERRWHVVSSLDPSQVPIAGLCAITSVRVCSAWRTRFAPSGPLAWFSHSGAPPLGGEPGIHNHQPGSWIPGSRKSAPRNDTAYDSNLQIAKLVPMFGVAWATWAQPRTSSGQRVHGIRCIGDADDATRCVQNEPRPRSLLRKRGRAARPHNRPNSRPASLEDVNRCSGDFP
jgi:hypothetical protein